MVPNASATPRIDASNPAKAARADLHCHSTASQLSKLGVQRSAGLPECATPPEEVYELAKRRGMDFVTITDHDTIDGVLQIAHLPDVFISEELTVNFRGEDQAVHVLCYGISPEDHEWLQRNRACVESCAEYLQANNIACALAHPFYAVEAPLTPRHRRRLTRLFEVWEIRNGSRAPELNMPAAVYIETHGGTGVAGSDDHAGVDIGRTFTRTPGRVHAGRVSRPHPRRPHGGLRRAGQRRKVGPRGPRARRPQPRSRDPRGRRWRRTDRRSGSGAAALRAGRQPGQRPDGEPRAASSAPTTRARCSSLDSAALGFSSADELIELMQAEGFTHAELQRRARAVHDGGLAEATNAAISALSDGEPELAEVLGELFGALVPVVPYAPAMTFLAGEKLKLAEPRRPLRPRRPRRRLDRLDARRLPHDRADPRARRPRLRGRGHRHRPRRRPAAAGRGRGRGSLLRGHEGRCAEPAGPRRDPRGGTLRADPRRLARPGRAPRRRCSRGSRGRRSSPAITPTSSPTRSCAPATRGSRASPRPR